MDCSPPGSSVYGILQARVLEWGAMASSEYTAKRSLNTKANKDFRFSQICILLYIKWITNEDPGMEPMALAQEDPLEEEMAINSSILAWRIP